MDRERADPRDDLVGKAQRCIGFHRDAKHEEPALACTCDHVAGALHHGRDGPPDLPQHVVTRAAAEYLQVVGPGIDLEMHQRDAAPVTLPDRPVAHEHFVQLLFGADTA